MVLENLGSGLKHALRKVAGLGVVDKEAVESILRDIQRSLLSADVDVALVSDLSKNIKKKVLEGAPAGMSLKEYFIKVLYEEAVSFLGKEKGEVPLKKQRILVIGLFGSGKSTSIGKIAKWFKTRGLPVGLVACDVHRPAAKDQLRQLGEKAGVPVYEDGETAEDVAKNALKKAKEDVLIFDSAGRDALDEELAKELKNLGKIILPDEVLLVLPAEIGQAARKQSEEFAKLVGITGIVITKLDGTAKGGGALAAAAVSGAKVKFIGTGEKLGDLEAYDPQRFVSKLIGYGDIQGLLEKAKEAGVEKTAKKLLEGEFTMETFYEQIEGMQGMGSLTKMVDMIPGMGGKLPKGVLDIQEEKMKKWPFIITSMTPKEKKEPELIKTSRINRLAKGSGTSETEVRELLKHYKQAKKVMKLTKGGKGLKRGPLAQIAKQFGMKM
ncbi:MAG: signal recognition particle protein [Candidatus Aenigmarchaeota archaeon]|nr:signal recognition particle protein [Candidatus Aenigmarchaeota archaeon]